MTKWYSTMYYMFNLCLCTSAMIFTDGKCNKFFSGWPLETFTTLDIWCTGPLWRSTVSVTARNTEQKITRYNWRWRIVWIKVSIKAHLRCLHVKHYQKVLLSWLLELWITNKQTSVSQEHRINSPIRLTSLCVISHPSFADAVE